ncbi:MAG: lysylphosphatidylglycerol synthase transmembrane domain-containing protein [Patescibacteria group bacterium]|nr:lysylphosphatidylglycerol synthase transmembrane domain-containing protein [Patescibacteria group bacterium]
MKGILKFLLALSISFLIFGIVMKTVGFRRIQEALFLFLGLKGIAILFLTFLICLISIMKWRFILKKITNQSKFKDLGKIWLAGFAVTYLFTPVSILGGEPVMIYLAQKRYSLNLKKSTASVIIHRFFDWTLLLIFTIVGLLAFLLYGSFPSIKIALIVTLVIGGLTGFFLLFYLKTLKKESTLEWFLKLLGTKKEKIENSQGGKLAFEIEKELIRFFSLRKKIFWQGFSFSFLRYLLFFSRASLLIFFLGGGVNLMRSLAIYGFNNLALFLPVPANLGGMEATGIFSFKTLGLTMASGTIFALVLRQADLVFSLIGVVFLIKLTLSSTKTKLLGFVNNLKNKK